jgi:carboxyl-terminal processing protease
VNVNEGAEVVDLPVVVLANQGAASGAEIVIGALQDHDRAQVVGTTTSGAGTVLNSFSLPDGAALLIAVEEGLPPDGRVIWQQGLTPDREVVLPEDVQPLIKLTFQVFTDESVRASGAQQFLTALEMLGEIAEESR